MKPNFARVSEEALTDGSVVYNVKVSCGEDNFVLIPCIGETEANALLYAIKINSLVTTY